MQAIRKTMFPFAPSQMWPPYCTLKLLTEHHDLGPSAVKKDHYVIGNIKAAILKHGNPFSVEGDMRYNLITPISLMSMYK